MFNPFAPFEPKFLAGFQQKGVKAFIKQTYGRGRNLLEENPMPAYLLIHTDDIGLAQEHYDAIKHDPGRQLFVLNDPEQLAELKRLLVSKSARYFTMLTIKDANERAKKLLDKKICFYVEKKTDWHPRNWDLVTFSLDFIFGEVYVKLKYGSREIKIKMEELEKISYVL